MGFGNGMAIGWPNASYQQGGPIIYEIPLFSCSLDPTPFIRCYSLSPSFAVGIYLYRHTDLTAPYDGQGGEYPGANQYIIANGLIMPENFSCG